MAKLIHLALVANALGFFLTVPCLVNTTPITMSLFFLVSLPLFGIGFVLYMAAVIRDLRKHQVL
jgi:hypothetical protein